MANHTPGKWRFEKHTGASDYFGNVTADLGKREDGVGLISTLAVVLKHPPKEQCEANARLIAAAPDLLEALRGVVRVADRATVEFDAARAAIEKATA